MFAYFAELPDKRGKQGKQYDNERGGKLSSKSCGKVVLWQIKKILHCHFPDLSNRLHSIKDPRTGVEYRIEELVMSAIVLFMLKCDSRNDFNNKSKDLTFAKNYKLIFGMRVPGMDAVNDLFERISPEEFEKIHCLLINALIEKRVFHRLRIFKNYFCIAIDGTGVYNWGDNPNDSIRQYALKKESKTGKVSYSSQILEAVLVCRNGLKIPLLSEWIANDGEDYDKQDCELKAFKRLSVKIKKYFPRLPVCILADGLYSNIVIMDICQQYGWKFITVFKDGNLPSIWTEVESLLPLSGGSFNREQYISNSTHRITCKYRWIKNIEYQKHSIAWIECVQESVHHKTNIQTTNRFVFLTDFDINEKVVFSIITAGRARWNIEDCFNSLKNRGGSLHHKFNRNSFNAIKNWHNARLLAFMIEEFVKHSSELLVLKKEDSKLTWKELWKRLISYLTMCSVNKLIVEFDNWSKSLRQVRLE